MGSVHFVVPVLDAAQHRPRPAGGLVEGLGNLDGLAGIVVDPDELLVGRAQELAKGVVVDGLLQAAELVVVRLAQGVVEGASVDEEGGAAEGAHINCPFGHDRGGSDANPGCALALAPCAGAPSQ